MKPWIYAAEWTEVNDMSKIPFTQGNTAAIGHRIEPVYYRY